MGVKLLSEEFCILVSFRLLSLPLHNSQVTYYLQVLPEVRGHQDRVLGRVARLVEFGSERSVI